MVRTRFTAFVVYGSALVGILAKQLQPATAEGTSNKRARAHWRTHYKSSTGVGAAASRRAGSHGARSYGRIKCKGLRLSGEPGGRNDTITILSRYYGFPSFGGHTDVAEGMAHLRCLTRCSSASLAAMLRPQRRDRRGTQRKIWQEFPKLNTAILWTEPTLNW